MFVPSCFRSNFTHQYLGFSRNLFPSLPHVVEVYVSGLKRVWTTGLLRKCLESPAAKAKAPFCMSALTYRVRCGVWKSGWVKVHDSRNDQTGGHGNCETQIMSPRAGSLSIVSHICGNPWGIIIIAKFASKTISSNSAMKYSVLSTQVPVFAATLSVRVLKIVFLMVTCSLMGAMAGNWPAPTDPQSSYLLPLCSGCGPGNHRSSCMMMLCNSRGARTLTQVQQGHLNGSDVAYRTRSNGRHAHSYCICFLSSLEWMIHYIHT